MCGSTRSVEKLSYTAKGRRSMSSYKSAMEMPITKVVTYTRDKRRIRESRK